MAKAIYIFYTSLKKVHLLQIQGFVSDFLSLFYYLGALGQQHYLGALSRATALSRGTTTPFSKLTILTIGYVFSSLTYRSSDVFRRAAKKVKGRT